MIKAVERPVQGLEGISGQHNSEFVRNPKPASVSVTYLGTYLPDHAVCNYEDLGTLSTLRRIEAREERYGDDL